VSNCSKGYINFNATNCYTQCPIGYFNVSNKCENTPNPNDNTVNPEIKVSHGKVIPFPCTIAYILIFGMLVGVKCLFPLTMLPSAVMSLGSII
jgi:hypothetical protein